MVIECCNGPVVKRIQVIDSHTGGEPTRIIVDGGPDLGAGSLADRRAIFAQNYDEIRSAVVNEPRGSDILVGGLLCQPTDPSCVAGVIFFNTVSYLGMCGHGTIGLMVTLEYLGRIEPGVHRLETPVGIVTAELHDHAQVSVQNVPAYRYRKDVQVDVPDYGMVVGDIAWGGNWFFLVKDTKEDLAVEDALHLTSVTMQIRKTLEHQAITGEDGGWIDHVELFGPPTDPQNHSKNFVLCPGGTYDRSPCGTGTSAKLACLAADGVLSPGQEWRQESIIGSVFSCSYKTLPDSDRVVPTITGQAHISGESTLLLDPSDPFCMGIRP